MIEYFIAKRYHYSKKRLSFIQVINRISLFGIAIGVATLIVVLSVFNGFGEISKSLMTEGEPHLIIDFIGPELDPNLVSLLNSNSEIQNFYKFSTIKVLAGTENNFEIINLITVDDSTFHSKDFIVNTQLDRDTLYANGYIDISFYLAIKLNLSIGDEINLTSFENLENAALTYTYPSLTKLKIHGIYYTRNSNQYKSFIYSTFKYTNNLFTKSTKSRLAIHLQNLNKSDDIKNLILKFSPNLKIKTWQDNHHQILTIMKIESLAAYLLLSLIIAVAAFNILTSLTMSVQMKKKDISILKTMGTNEKMIKKIFIYEGILNGIKGTSWGFIIGILIYFAQKYFAIYKLDSSKYILDAMPVSLSLIDLLAIIIMSLTLSFLSTLYPAYQASKIKLTESIKWE